MAVDPQLGRDAYRFWKAGDKEGIDGIISRDIVWHAVGFNPDTYSGRKEVLAYVSSVRRAAATDGTFKIKVTNVIAHGDFVIGRHRSTARRRGKTLSDDEILVGRVRGGRFIEVWQFFQDPDAVMRFWGDITGSGDTPRPQGRGGGRRPGGAGPVS